MAEVLTHEQAAELLPWLANGTLAGEERRAVREHADACVLCRRELETLDALARHFDGEAAAMPLPPPDMRRINARIDDHLERERRGPAMLAHVRGWLSNPWRAAFVVQGLAALALVAFLLRPVGTMPEYTTLTTPEPLAPGHYLRVVFDPNLGTAAIDEWLSRHSLAVANGPSAGGVYTLRYADALDAAQRDAVQTDLEADAAILFVQPVGQGGVE